MRPRSRPPGASANGAVAYGGGSLTLTGTTIATTGDGSDGLVVNDAGTMVTATNVTISTQGAIDSSTTSHANGVYNGASPTGTSGGTLTLTNVAVTTAGFELSGVVTSTGGARLSAAERSRLRARTPQLCW